MKKNIIAFLILSLTDFTISAQSRSLISAGLSADEGTLLMKDGEITRYFFHPEDLQYTFDSSFSKEINSQIKALSPNIGVESLFFYKTDKDYSMIDIYNILLSISTMEGIEYYSQSRKRMRTLFTESYVIRGKEDDTRVPDFRVTDKLKEISFYAHQTDKTFGENIYKTEYRSDGKTIWIRMTNETPMKYKFIKMVNPGDISINVLIRKVEGGLLFYGVTGVHTFSFLGIERAKKESFYNRIKALYGWFTGRLQE